MSGTSFGKRRLFVLAAPIAALLSGCLSPVPRELLLDGGRVELDIHIQPGFVSAAGAPVVEGVDLEGAPSRLLVDTGAEAATISATLAAALPCASRWNTPGYIVGAQGGVVRAERVVRVEQLELAGAAFRGFDAMVVGDSLLAPFGLDGILGIALFSGCTTTIDFAAQKLILEREPLDAESPGVISVRVDGDGFIHVPVEVAGRPAWALLDTGSSDILSVPRGTWRTLPRKGSERIESIQAAGFTIEGPSTSSLERLDGALEVAGRELPSPWVSVTEGGHLSVGSGAFAGCSLTMDLPNRLLRLRPGAQGLEGP